MKDTIDTSSSDAVIPKKTVIDEYDLEKMSPVFKGKTGHGLARFFLHFVAIDKVNKVYGNSCAYKGADFAGRLLDDLGVCYQVGNAERLRNLPEGAFITISNHPYGGVDGIMMIDLMARVRPDYKFMVNQLLSLVKTMDDNFIKVTPKTDNNSNGTSTTSLKGIRETLVNLQEGHPVGFFPSGAVSDFSLKTFRVRDREWQESIVRLIQSARVPIIPIRFFDRNSYFFYFLGLIDWRIRSLRMPSELFNKRKLPPHIGIGEILTVEDQARFSDLKSFGTYLRNAVYDMPRPAAFVSKNELKLLGK